MTKHRFVSTAPIGPTAIDILQRIAAVETAPDPQEQTMLKLVDGTIGLVARGEGMVTGRIIRACADLRVIGRPGAGYDTVDVAAATASKIPVVYAPVGGFAVAEGALALLLAVVKQLLPCDRVVREGRWQERYERQTGDLAEHTLGIVGLGKIGSQLAGLARPFGMTILAYDPYADRDWALEQGIKLVSLDELLGCSDYVSIHVPLNDETRGLINREGVSSMKTGAVLVNTSRGGVVESLDVLADALDDGQLDGVGLDVFPQEPPDTSHRLFTHPRCVFTPHLVGVSKLAMERLYRSMASDMVAVIQGARPKHCVNPEVF